MPSLPMVHLACSSCRTCALTLVFLWRIFWSVTRSGRYQSVQTRRFQGGLHWWDLFLFLRLEARSDAAARHPCRVGTSYLRQSFWNRFFVSHAKWDIACDISWDGARTFRRWNREGWDSCCRIDAWGKTKRSDHERCVLDPTLANLSSLQRVSASHATEAKYKTQVEQFLSFADEEKLTLVADDEVDAAIVQYLNTSYSQGRPVSDGGVLLAGLLFFQPQYGKLGRQKLARSWRALKGWRKRAPTRSTRPLPRMIWSGLESAGKWWETRKLLWPRLDDGRDVLTTWRTLAIGATGPDQTDESCGKRLVTAPQPCSTRRAEQNTELRRHNRLEKPNLSLDHQSGCSPGGWPTLRKDFRTPTRRVHQRVSKSNAWEWRTLFRTSAAILVRHWTKRDYTAPCWRSKKRRRWKSDNSVARYGKSRRLAQIQPDLNKKSTHLLLSHRLSSRGAYLRETPSGRRFATLSDGGRLFLNLFSSDRVGRAAQRLGVRAAFRNLKYGEQYDVTHPVNLRRLLKDIADEGILDCMMSVPFTGWNVARRCCRPLRSSAQPWGIEKSRASMSPSNLAVLTQATVSCEQWSNWHNNVIASTYRGRSRIQKNLCVGWHHSWRSFQRCAMYTRWLRYLCFWYQMAKTYNGPGRARGLGRRVGPRHHALSRTQAVHLYWWEKHATRRLRLFSSVLTYTQAQPIRRNWQADSRICFWDPPSPPECREHAVIGACNGRDDTPCCAESSLRRVQAVTSGLPCFPVAETLPRREETQFLEKYERRVSILHLNKNDTSRRVLRLHSLFCFSVAYPLWLCHEGGMTRPGVQSLLCAESKPWHQDCLAFQSQRPCQGVTRHIFLKKSVKINIMYMYIYIIYIYIYICFEFVVTTAIDHPIVETFLRVSTMSNWR